MTKKNAICMNWDDVAFITLLISLILLIIFATWYSAQPTIRVIKIDKLVKLFRADDCPINGGCIQPFECWQEYNNGRNNYIAPDNFRCSNITPRQVLCSDDYYYRIESWYYVFVSMNEAYKKGGYDNVNETLSCW